MCVAVGLKPRRAAKEITKKTLRLCWDENPHGAGFMFVSDNKVLIEKGFFDFDEFFDTLMLARELHPDSWFGVHFRIASAGVISADNCHPFWIKEGEMAVIHNGTIQGLPGVSKDSAESDTCVFARDILAKLPDGFLENEAIRELIEDRIGYSKLFVLTADNRVFIYNENAGVWINGNWFSNTRWKPKPKKEELKIVWNDKRASRNFSATEAIAISKKHKTAKARGFVDFTKTRRF